MVHELKILPCYFNDVRNGIKTFEVRKDDRPYASGDILILREFNSLFAEYTGRLLICYVPYVLRGDFCKEGYCIMSIVKLF